MNNITIPKPVLDLYTALHYMPKTPSKKKCIAFSQTSSGPKRDSIENIYVINLDRQPQRWEKVLSELTQILDFKGRPLSEYVTRISAVDALEFENVVKSENVDKTYTLGEQLYVDPRRVLPSKLNLDEKIQMSRQEIAVALSHIDIWKKIATGKDQYALVLEDDIYLSYKFSDYVGKVWHELLKLRGKSVLFDILYLSYREVELGAEKHLLLKIHFSFSEVYGFIWICTFEKRSAETVKPTARSWPRRPLDKS